MEPYTKSYNETYLDYIRGKPQPKPVTPPEISEHDDEDSLDCDHSTHYHPPKTIQPDTQSGFTHAESIFSRGRPRIQNVKTQQEVPPIVGDDYINPSYDPNMDQGYDNMSTGTPMQQTANSTMIRTGLPENHPGHDSMLLSLSKKETEGMGGNTARISRNMANTANSTKLLGNSKSQFFNGKGTNIFSDLSD